MVEIITAIAGPLMSGLIALYVSTVQNDKTVALVQYRLQQLEDKVATQNDYIEKVILAERDLKTAFRRIDELRDDVKALSRE